MKFYDLHVHPKTPEKAGEIIKTAERLGWDGICLVEPFDNLNNFKKFRDNVLNLRNDTKIEIFIGAEIKELHPALIYLFLANASKSQLKY